MTQPAQLSPFPTYDQLMWPTLEALKELGGSGNIQEIEAKVAELQGFSEAMLAVPHAKSSRSEIGYRLAWTRTFLRWADAIEQSGHGIWIITEKGRQLDPTSVGKISSEWRAWYKASKNLRGEAATIPEQEIQSTWQDILLDTLQAMSPPSFERLSQRILRESGFTKVEVTGKSGDGGIDGVGVLVVNNVISFQVFFQCKRYRGSVGAGQIRDFRGPMVGRTDKGLFITTGVFTADAKKEATRDGAPVLDLIDADVLCELLKKLNLGVSTQMVEEVTVDADWFKAI